MNSDTTPFSKVSREPQWGPKMIVGDRHRFQLWAPAQKEVSLWLNGVGIPMARFDDGWHSIETSARYGSEYAFVLGNGRLVGDPASRQQAGEIDGPSILTDPDSYHWRNADWCGRPWEETIVYEIHIGTFTELSGGDQEVTAPCRTRLHCHRNHAACAFSRRTRLGIRWCPTVCSAFIVWPARRP